MTAPECRCSWDRYHATCPRFFHRYLAAQPQPVTAPPIGEWFVPGTWDQEAAK